MDFEPTNNNEYIELINGDLEDLKISFLNYANGRIKGSVVLSQIEAIKHNLNNLKGGIKWKKKGFMRHY